MSWLINLAVFGRLVLAAAFPQPVGYVNDFAEVISPATEAELETKLENFTGSTGNELAVVTIKSLNGDTIENTAVGLFEQWGIGKKDQDNGVLLLVAPNDRELRIEVGYGLEPVLTDSRAGNIIRDVIAPKFKENNYEAGISDGVASIITVLGSKNNFSSDGGWVAIFIIFIIIIIVIWMIKRWGKPGSIQGKRSSRGTFSSGKSGGRSFGGFSGGSSGGGGASGRW